MTTPVRLTCALLLSATFAACSTTPEVAQIDQPITVLANCAVPADLLQPREEAQIPEKGRPTSNLVQAFGEAQAALRASNADKAALAEAMRKCGGK